jgi:hypothetical protein
MRAENDSCAVIEQVLNGWQSCGDAGIISNLAILNWDVEINPYENFLAFNIQVGDNLLIEHIYTPLGLKSAQYSFWMSVLRTVISFNLSTD